MAPFVSLFGPIDAILAPYVEYVLLVLLLVNMAARILEYNQHREQAEDGDWKALSRHPLRVGTNLLLVVGTFYYLTLHHHAGLVFSTLILGLFIADLFEFESRQVEVRQGFDLDRPKGAIAASVLALLYILFHTLFFLVKPVWNQVI